MAKFDKLTWIVGGKSFTECSTRDPEPSHAIKIVFEDRYTRKYLVWTESKLILKVKDEKTGKYHEENIYGVVKYFYNRRVTKKVRDALREEFANCDFQIRNGEISNIYSILGNFFDEYNQ